MPVGVKHFTVTVNGPTATDITHHTSGSKLNLIHTPQRTGDMDKDAFERVHVYCTSYSVLSNAPKYVKVAFRSLYNVQP